MGARGAQAEVPAERVRRDEHLHRAALVQRRHRALLEADFVGGRHDHGWDACGGTWSDGSNMEYQGAPSYTCMPI